ncbi:MAG: ABC-type dipeptide transport system, periplasmic component [Jatrophihabitantaceae bacterium]|nr:ABC-type dipeptide transport system, periplasmic component [Jatrophihabitantaceae bacterium]
MHRGRLAGLTAGALALTLLAACGGGSSGGGGSDEFESADVTGIINGALPTDGPPQSGGKIVITDPSDAPTVDPHKAASAYTHFGTSGIVYSTLVAYKYGKDIPYYSQDFTGDLAETWDHTDDGLTWTFNLRKGVKWQNIAPVSGREFTAADVKCTVERIQTLPGVQKNLMDIVASVDATDPYKAIFKLKSPYGALDETMASFYMEILPCEGTRGEFDLAQQAIGTGPFILQSWERKVKRTYVKNPDYYVAGKPYLDEIDVLIMSDPAAALASFRAGGLDVSNVSETLYSSLLGSNPDVPVRVQEGLTLNGIFMNESIKPFDDVRVRKAISMAWDRAGMGDANYTSFTLAGAYPGVMPGSLTDGETKDLRAYDPTAAKKLLAEAGFPNGFDIELTTTDGWGPTITNQAQWVQQDLKDIGINVTLKVLDYATFYTTWQKKDYSLGYALFTGFLTVNEWVQSFYPTAGPRNWFNIDDPKLNTMIKAQESTIDPDDRAKKLHEISTYIAENVSNPVLGMQGSTLQIQQSWVHNMYPNPAYARAWAADVWVDADSPSK